MWWCPVWFLNELSFSFSQRKQQKPSLITEQQLHESDYLNACSTSPSSLGRWSSSVATDVSLNCLFPSSFLLVSDLMVSSDDITSSTVNPVTGAYLRASSWAQGVNKAVRSRSNEWSQQLLHSFTSIFWRSAAPLSVVKGSIHRRRLSCLSRAIRRAWMCCSSIAANLQRWSESEVSGTESETHESLNGN